ncbi:MAG TPA: PAS domain S-box protein [Methanosarcinaceae archaeon]|nr:PAS domain S-box protein [Methanosarcinaceae archaeon]
MTLKDSNQDKDKKSLKKHTHEIELNEKYLSLICDTFSDAIFLLAVEPDDCFRFVFVNQAFLAVTGLTGEQVVGKRIEQVLPETAHALVIGKYKEAISKNKTVFWEENSTYSTGERVGVVTVTPAQTAEEVYTHLVGTVHDLTERKQADEVLKESEERYRTIFETTGTAMLIGEEDTTISVINAEFEKICLYSKEEIEGKKSWIEFIVKADQEKIKDSHRLRMIDPNVAPPYYEIQFIDKQDNIKDGFITVNLIPGTKKTVASLIDITERKKTEEALRESEKRFRTIFDSINDAVFIHDMETGVIHDVNSTMCKMYGYSREEVGQLDIEALSSGEVPYTQQDALEWNKKAAMGEAQVFEWMAKHKSGHLFWVEISMKKAVISLQERLLVVVRDITERKQAEEELQERINELETFYRTTLGREERVIELKQEVNELLEKLGENNKYRDYSKE